MLGFLILTAEAAAETGAGAQTAGWAETFSSLVLPIAAMFALFYFLMYRPEKKRKKEITDMRNSLKTGDEIVTIGGIVGKITNIKDEQLTIETGSDKNKLRIMKWAVSSRESKEDKEDKEA